MKKQLLWLGLWGISFGMIEAAVVIYLRKIYYPAEFHFPPVPFGDCLFKVELAREAATLLILWAAAELSTKKLLTKFAVFMLLFGLWDIFYYVFLKTFLNWPESFLTWDILFMIPWVWAGPVLAPILVSLGLISAGIMILHSNEKNVWLNLDWEFWTIETVACTLILTSFLIPGKEIISGIVPSSFPWGLFGLGLFGGFGYFTWKYKSQIM